MLAENGEAFVAEQVRVGMSPQAIWSMLRCGHGVYRVKNYVR